MKKNILFLVLLVFSVRVSASPALPVFSLAVLPDTQMYSRYNGGIFQAQTRWIAEHAVSDNIVFTTHLGDVVDRNYQEYEWQNADWAMSILDTKRLPYTILAGNHDLLNATRFDNERDIRREPFMRYFPPERVKAQPGYGAHSPSGFNSYSTFRVSGQLFLVLALDWRLSAQSIEWVQSVLDAYHDVPTIVTTHQLLRLNRQGTPELTYNGNVLWTKLIAPHNQVFLVMGGHFHGVGHMVQQNQAGNDVLLLLVDYQADYQGGNGMMRLLTFDLAEKTIAAESFSPYVMAKPPGQRSPYDKERKTDPANQFTVSLDIMARFQPEPAE